MNDYNIFRKYWVKPQKALFGGLFDGWENSWNDFMSDPTGQKSNQYVDDLVYRMDKQSGKLQYKDMNSEDKAGVEKYNEKKYQKFLNSKPDRDDYDKEDKNDYRGDLEEWKEEKKLWESGHYFDENSSDYLKKYQTPEAQMETAMEAGYGINKLMSSQKAYDARKGDEKNMFNLDFSTNMGRKRFQYGGDAQSNPQMESPSDPQMGKEALQQYLTPSELQKRFTSTGSQTQSSEESGAHPPLINATGNAPESDNNTQYDLSEGNISLLNSLAERSGVPAKDIDEFRRLVKWHESEITNPDKPYLAIQKLDNGKPGKGRGAYQYETPRLVTDAKKLMMLLEPDNPQYATAKQIIDGQITDATKLDKNMQDALFLAGMHIIEYDPNTNVRKIRANKLLNEVSDPHKRGEFWAKVWNKGEKADIKAFNESSKSFYIRNKDGNSELKSNLLDEQEMVRNEIAEEENEKVQEQKERDLKPNRRFPNSPIKPQNPTNNVENGNPNEGMKALLDKLKKNSIINKYSNNV